MLERMCVRGRLVDVTQRQSALWAWAPEHSWAAEPVFLFLLSRGEFWRAEDKCSKPLSLVLSPLLPCVKAWFSIWSLGVGLSAGPDHGGVVGHGLSHYVGSWMLRADCQAGPSEATAQGHNHSPPRQDTGVSVPAIDSLTTDISLFNWQ